MKKLQKTIILSVALFLVASFIAAGLPNSVWAQESDTNIVDEVRRRIIEEGRNILDDVGDNKEKVRTEIRDRRDEVRTEVTEKRDEARTNIQDRREELREKNLKAREELRQRIENRKEELKAAVEEKREELKDRIEQKREELKERLETIRDERKKEVVKRIDQRMDALNKRLLDHFLSVLDKLDTVLIRIAERADSAEERGADVSAVRIAIDEANEAIVIAKAAIEAQAGKTYTIQITDEEALRTDVGRARQALHGDLTAVREIIREAFAAVRNAATTLARAMEAIPTPTPEVTETENQ